MPDSNASEVFLHRLHLTGEPRSFARTGGPVAIRSRLNSCTLYILHSSVFALSGVCGFTLVYCIHVSLPTMFGSRKTGAYCGLSRLIACIHRFTKPGTVSTTSALLFAPIQRPIYVLHRFHLACTLKSLLLASLVVCCLLFLGRFGFVWFLLCFGTSCKRLFQ